MLTTPEFEQRVGKQGGDDLPLQILGLVFSLLVVCCGQGGGDVDDARRRRRLTSNGLM